MTRSRSGMSLIELIVVLTIVGLLLGVSAVALRLPDGAREDATTAAWSAAARVAAQSGRPQPLVVPDSVARRLGTTTHLLFLPDGRVVGGGRASLTGRLPDQAGPAAARITAATPSVEGTR